jgi:hypothetical protein
LQLLQSQALTYLALARVDGDWEKFDQAILEIGKKGYNSHKTTKALNKERDHAKERRTFLQELCRQIEQAIAKDRFDDAYEIVDTLENDAELGDKDNLYGVRATVRVRDPKSGDILPNWRTFKNWLAAVRSQLDEVARWLMGAGTVALLDANDYPYTLPSNAPRRIVAWPEMRTAIRVLVDKGRFDEAQRQLQGIVEGNQGWYSPEERIIALAPATHRLATSPLQPAQALSKTAVSLLQAGQEHHRDVLAPHLREAEGVKRWIGEQKQHWEEAYQELGQAFAELSALQAKNPLWRLREKNKEQILAATTRVRQALLRCQQIAPEHANLKGMNQHPLLKV